MQRNEDSSLRLPPHHIAASCNSACVLPHLEVALLQPLHRLAPVFWGLLFRTWRQKAGSFEWRAGKEATGADSRQPD